MWTAFKQASSPGVPVDKDQGCPLAYHFEMFKFFNIKGVGVPYNPGPASQKLHAFINQWSVEDWEEDEWFADDDVTPMNILAHETQHDVCCFVKFYDRASGKISTELLGEGGAHWSMYYNSYGQMMYGGNWREEGNGTFYAVDQTFGTRQMDRYLWGLIPKEDVPQTFIVDTSTPCTPTDKTLTNLKADCPGKDLSEFDLCLEPPYYKTSAGCSPYKADLVQAPYHVRAKGTKKWVDIKDITQVNGDRYPDWTSSYKYNTQIFILAVTKDVPLEQEQLDKLDRFRRRYSRHMYEVTGYKLRNLNTVDGADDSPMWEWGGDTRWQGDDEMEGWKGEGLKQALALKKSKEENEEVGELVLSLKGKDSGITHDNLRLEGELYDALQVRMTVPLPADGKPKMLYGAFKLSKGSSSETVRFPVYADGKRHTVTVHPPHKLLRKEACKDCVMRCRFAEKLKMTDPGTDKDLTCEKDVDCAIKQTCVVGACSHTKDFPCKQDADCALKTTCDSSACNAEDSRMGWYKACNVNDPAASDNQQEELFQKGACKDDKGQTLCGPYCSRPETDSVLDAGAAEGWYDSCKSELDQTYDTLTLYPVISDEASGLKGPVQVDRIDLFAVKDIVKEEGKLKDGEKDWDGDGLINAFDNCPIVANPMQIDSNDDEKGDACGDSDADGIVNALDNCPAVVNSLQQDADNDGVGDVCDPDYEEGCSVGGSGTASWPLGLALLLGLLALVRRRRR